MDRNRGQYRLPYYNYASSGMYFVTICSHLRNPLFGSVSGDTVLLSSIGQIAGECLQNLPRKQAFVSIDEWVIMPDHVHAIIVIDNPDEPNAIAERSFGPQSRSLSIVVRNFKAVVTLLARREGFNGSVWQRRFYDRIIRNEKELQTMRTYIQNNPLQWYEDRKDPDAIT